MMLSTYAALVRENRNFRLLWLAQIVSELGDWFYALAVYSLILSLTGSAGLVGLAVVLQVLPQTFIAPTAGVVNDRLSRKRIMIAADLVRAVVVLGILLVRTRETIWLIFPLLFVETVMAAFFEPARSSVIPNITPKFMEANTLSSTTWSFNLAVGSTLGGLVAFLLGREAVFVINAFSFLVSAALIARMSFSEPHMEGSRFRWGELVDFSPVVEGIRYIRSDPRLLVSVFAKTGLGFIGANNVLLPLLGKEVFANRFTGVDPERAGMLGMSLLMGARGVGALIGPFVSGYWAGEGRRRLPLGILIGFLLAAASYAALGLQSSLSLTVLAVILAHSGGSTIWVFSTTLLHHYTEDKFRGRVFAAELGFCMLTISASSYLAGLAVDRGIPVRTCALYIGMAVLLPAAAWAAALRLWKRG